MALPKFLRERLFDLMRRDLALFLADHEEHLLVIFREEMRRLDDEIPEESLFIDIQMVPLGEAILKSALHAMTRFLTEDFKPATEEAASPVTEVSPPDISDAV